MTALLLANNSVRVNIPASLGGGSANYNYFLNARMFIAQAFSIPANMNNKEVLILGEVWTKASMNNKTSANTLHITWNNFNNSIELKAASRHYTANAKIKVEKRVHLGNVQNLQLMLSSWQTGSANARRGWNVGLHLAPEAALTFYYN